jgi:hypothetical protein
VKWLYDYGVRVSEALKKRKYHAADSLSPVLKKCRMVSEGEGGWHWRQWGCPPSSGGV